MVTFKDFIKPNGLKVILALVLLIPSFILSFIVISITFQNVLVLILMGIIFSYFFACLLDSLIKNKTIKIVFASISALVSIIIGYIWIRSMTMVCDPVHHVPTECELACREIIDKATNRTPEIMDKFRECMQNCYK